MLMRADKPDEDDAGVVMDFHNETVVVAFNVEDDAIVGENISGGILDFDLVEIFPVSPPILGIRKAPEREMRLLPQEPRSKTVCSAEAIQLSFAFFDRAHWRWGLSFAQNGRRLGAGCTRRFIQPGHDP